MSVFLLILQPLFADGQALNADAGQAGAWAMLYRYGSIGVVGLWTACLMMPQKMVRRVPDIASFVLMGCVIWEAVVALNQLYGNGMSNHVLYGFTGTFLNPGPFSGFLAMGVPLAVHGLLSPLQLPQRGFCLLTLVLCLLLLPAGMSRSAWGAAIAGAAAVYGMHRWRSVREWCGTLLQSRKRLMAVGGAFVLCIGMGWGAFHLKEDSANGRLLMWKVACHAIAERPWTGYGAEGFPTAYAETQERYFASRQGTEGERHVAGTPEHAFNEYLTVAVKYGVGGLMGMLAIGITAFACALRGRAYGMAGTLLTVAVFASSAYPLQLPDFLSAVMVVVAVLFGLLFRHGLHELRKACVLTSFYKATHTSYEVMAVAFVLFSACIVATGIKQTREWQTRHEAAKEWRNARTLYHMEAYSVVCEDYAPLYGRMRWNHNYLFEYGRALHQTGRYEESNRILQEAERLCGDPMILNIQGKNHEALEQFDQAATLYRRAYNRLPNRLYPLYLEMMMYASPACNRPEAAKEIAQRILDTKEKIPSKAVEEMKERARGIVMGRFPHHKRSA